MCVCVCVVSHNGLCVCVSHNGLCVCVLFPIMDCVCVCVSHNGLCVCVFPIMDCVCVCVCVCVCPGFAVGRGVISVCLKCVPLQRALMASLPLLIID